MVTKIPLLPKDQLELLEDNMEEIVATVEARRDELLTPTLAEYRAVMEVIVGFIRSKKRVVYGGSGWNALLERKSKSLAFYGERARKDIEFYSNRPLHDLKELCDLLADKGFAPVSGRNASHDDTYSIFVNYAGSLCDITYMPSNVLYRVPTIVADGLRIVHPKFSLVDVLRIYNTPLISAFRWEKTLRRARRLIEAYPLEFASDKEPKDERPAALAGKLRAKALEWIRKEGAGLLVGDAAWRHYLGKTAGPESVPELITDKLALAAPRAHELLKKASPSIEVREFHPFFQFWDKRVEFYLDGACVLRLFGHNCHCLPYREVKGAKIGTFNVVVMHELMRYHYAVTNGDRTLAARCDGVVASLLRARAAFLAKEKVSVLDEGLYRDFQAECYGVTIDQQRKYRLARRSREVFVVDYNPATQRDRATFLEHSFGNYSGNAINSPVRRLIKV